ncbi:hypothetical protein RUM43_009489 [Polyplax serrata]|uniref:Uncharacterized protein n=1 Tax=Polyplax serrata TaxID=468196 RepID=A0AAN8NW68_POLSC
MWFTTPDHPFKIANFKTKIKRRKNECGDGMDAPNGPKWGGHGKKANWEFMNFNPGLFQHGRRCSSVQDLDLSGDGGREFRRCNSVLGDLKPEEAFEIPPKEIRGRTFPNMRDHNQKVFMCEDTSFFIDLYRRNNLRATEFIRRNFSERNLAPLADGKIGLESSQKYKSEFNLFSAQQRPVWRSSFFHRSNQSLKKRASLREQDEDEMGDRWQSSEIRPVDNQNEDVRVVSKPLKKSKVSKRNKRKQEEKKTADNGQTNKLLNSNKSQSIDKTSEKSRVSRMFGASGFGKLEKVAEGPRRQRNRGNELIRNGKGSFAGVEEAKNS